jgi:hypothetical protein
MIAIYLTINNRWWQEEGRKACAISATMRAPADMNGKHGALVERELPWLPTIPLRRRTCAPLSPFLYARDRRRLPFLAQGIIASVGTGAEKTKCVKRPPKKESSPQILSPLIKTCYLKTRYFDIYDKNIALVRFFSFFSH